MCYKNSLRDYLFLRYAQHAASLVAAARVRGRRRRYALDNSTEIYFNR